MTRDLKLGLLLAVASLFGCRTGFDEQPAQGEEKRCVGPDGKFAEDKACSGAATGTWGDDQRAGGAVGTNGAAGTNGAVGMNGYHHVYVPFGYYMLGASAAGFMRSTTPGSGHAVVAAGRAGAPASASARGGFGATGTAHTTGTGHTTSAGT